MYETTTKSAPLIDNGGLCQVHSDSTDAEFEDILNQLNALGNTIDQELSQTSKFANCKIDNSNKSMQQSAANDYHYYDNRYDVDDDHDKDDEDQEDDDEHSDDQILTVVVENTGQNGRSVMPGSLPPPAPSRPQAQTHQRTDSPDNDSAFSDTISLISSEQSSSSSSSSTTSCLSTTMNNKQTTTQTTIRQVISNHHDDDNNSSQSINNNSNNGHNDTNQINQNGQQPKQQMLLHSPTSSQPPIHSTLMMIKNNNLRNNNHVHQRHQHQQQQIFFEQNNNNKSINHNDQNSTDDDVNGTNVNEDSTRLNDQIELMNNEFDFENMDSIDDDKIRIALNKINEANIRKLYLKIFTQDDSSKCLLANEQMNVGHICQQMAEKNHCSSFGADYCIVEHLPQLYLERFYEDHESLVENVLYWGRDHHNSNKLYFVQQQDKYDLFMEPEKYLISHTQPNITDNVNTLKSGSLRAKFNANQLRQDLIDQFFANNTVRIPEIEGNLHLRSDGKKTWKKYFFTLRSSGLYYCPKGRPKSTKDLICLTTFELNCVYSGFGWRKKFKAPNDFGFAIKHPQIQTKSPKHIKYLCAETVDDLKLWMTGIRIAKYGHRLLENYQKFKLINNGGDHSPSSSSSSSHVDHHFSNNNNKKITTFPLNETNDPLRMGHNFEFNNSNNGSASNLNEHYPTITMRSTNQLNLPHSSDDSIRSSSASSSSGCISEQSIQSSSSGSNNIDLHMTSTSCSPHLHHPPQYSHIQHQQQHSHQPAATTNQSNAFDVDFPIGTIKRKPNVMIQPKIPLTNTTRNLALHSDDALLEVGSDDTTDEHDDGQIGKCNDVNNDNLCLLPYTSDSRHGATVDRQLFQHGTLKTGTFRRSTPEEMVQRNSDNNKPKMIPSSPTSNHHIHHGTTPVIAVNNELNLPDDDLLPPPPPPPPPLKEAESTLSLNASFPPPPSPETTELLNHPEQQQRPPPPKQPSPPSMSSLPLPPMTPQPQMKNRLARRLSDLTENSSYYMSFRGSNNGNYCNNENNYSSTNNVPRIYGPNSRASFASANDSNHVNHHSFSLKSSQFGHSSNNRPQFQRYNSVDQSYYQQQQNSMWDKYGTTPRSRPPMESVANNIMNDQQQFYQRKLPQENNNNNIYMSCNNNVNSNISGQKDLAGNSHCTIVSDAAMAKYDLLPNGMRISSQQIILPPPPPPPAQSITQSNPQSPCNYASFTLTNNEPVIKHRHPEENHYMSISPHLLQKHQQMLQRQQSSSGPTNHVSYHLPEDLFLRNMERVMQKKWNVAQMLQQDQTATPGKVLGFRDSAYLPPPPPPPENSQPQQPPSIDDYNARYQGHYNPNNMAHTKSVQFSMNGPTLIMENVSPMHQSNNHHHNNYQISNYADGGGHGGGHRNSSSKIPPPPPKRSDSTQLSNQCCPPPTPTASASAFNVRR